MAYLDATAGARREAAAASAIVDVAGLIPAGGTGATAGAYDTAGNRDTALVTVTELKTKLNAVIAALRAEGVIAT